MARECVPHGPLPYPVRAGRPSPTPARPGGNNKGGNGQGVALLRPMRCRMGQKFFRYSHDFLQSHMVRSSHWNGLAGLHLVHSCHGCAGSSRQGQNLQLRFNTRHLGYSLHFLSANALSYASRGVEGDVASVRGPACTSPVRNSAGPNPGL